MLLFFLLWKNIHIPIGKSTNTVSFFPFIVAIDFSSSLTISKNKHDFHESVCDYHAIGGTMIVVYIHPFGGYMGISIRQGRREGGIDLRVIDGDAKNSQKFIEQSIIRSSLYLSMVSFSTFSSPNNKIKKRLSDFEYLIFLTEIV
jgi:hypothetical protein